MTMWSHLAKYHTIRLVLTVNLLCHDCNTYVDFMTQWTQWSKCIPWPFHMQIYFSIIYRLGLGLVLKEGDSMRGKKYTTVFLCSLSILLERNSSFTNALHYLSGQGVSSKRRLLLKRSFFSWLLFLQCGSVAKFYTFL